VSAEDLLLSKRLSMLCDHEDVLLTMDAARIKVEENLDIIDNSEKLIRETQEKRLRTALKYAKMEGSLPGSLRELATKVVLIVKKKVES
jgi:hypothetical protein